jgi:hypothetical protein
MPFTFSHPAIVLPLSKKWFSLTALVAGSIIPDFEYFFKMKGHSDYGHNLDGLFWFDLPLALLLMWVYNRFVKNKLIDHLPSYFNKRLSPLKNTGRRFFKHHWIIIIISVLIGSASHILWDNFTHMDGYFVSLFPSLTKWFNIAGYNIPVVVFLQLSSSVIGLLIIFFAIMNLPVGKLTNTNNHVLRYWMKITAITLFILVLRYPTGFVMAEFFGDVVDTAISGGLIGLLIVSFTTPANPVTTHTQAVQQQA